MEKHIFKKNFNTIYNNSSLLRICWFYLRFLKKNKYIPNFKTPKTYNEKVNYRKNNPKNDLFSVCADKIKAKEYVAEIISPEVVIPNYYIGDSISFEKMKELLEINGDCLLKANHNSGPVYLIKSESSVQEIQLAVKDVNKQLEIDYGKLKNETWYSDIKPRVLVEKRLPLKEGETDLKDYKFHMFKQNDGSFKVILHVDYDRNSNHNRSYFDVNLNWLPFSVKYPSVRTVVEKPKNYEMMVEYAKKLAEPFSYVRVDFYNIDGDIFFGELTFAHESGCGEFTSKAYDLWMGNLWQGDPRF